MQVKDQLRVRMEQLQIDVTTLAKRIGVSNQSVRHWLNGRSFPGKRHVPDLEKALSMKLDFSEGETPTAVPTVEATLQAGDIELFLKISRLPPELKRSILGVVDAFLLHTTRVSVADPGGAFVPAAKHSPPRRQAAY